MNNDVKLKGLKGVSDFQDLYISRFLSMMPVIVHYSLCLSMIDSALKEITESFLLNKLS